MKRAIYIDDKGMWYKVQVAVGEPKPREASHALRPLVTDDFYKVLPDDGTPMHMIDIEAAIQKLVSTGRK